MAKKQRHQGYFRCEDSIFERTDLTPGEKLVYIYFRRKANKSGESFPRYSTIARDCGFSRRHVIRVVAKLVELGLVVKVYRKNQNGWQRSNIYVVKPLAGNVTNQVTSKHISKEYKDISNIRTSYQQEKRKEMIRAMYNS